MIKIRLYANLREIAGKEASVAGKEATLMEVLEKLFQQHPALREAVLEGNRIREHCNVLLNGRNVAHLKGLKTIVKDGDEISIFPPVAGGSGYSQFPSTPLNPANHPYDGHLIPKQERRKKSRSNQRGRGPMGPDKSRVLVP